MEHLLIYMVIGTTAGTIAGMLGIGGGVIVIPCLAWTFSAQGMANNLIMHMAAGTSLAAMTLNSSASLYGHLKHKVEVWPIYKLLVTGMVFGVILGAIFGHLLHSNILGIIFALFMLIMGIRMILAMRSKPSRKMPGIWGSSTAGFVIGAKSGILGIGGGAITIPFLTYCNVPVRNTLATSVACSLTIAIFGTLSFIITGIQLTNLPPWAIGYIYLPAFFGLIITGPICARLGASISHKLPTENLKKILGAILILMAIKMLL